MALEEGGGDLVGEGAFEGGVDGFGFALVGDGADDGLGFHDLIGGHADGLGGDVV